MKYYALFWWKISVRNTIIMRNFRQLSNFYKYIKSSIIEGTYYFQKVFCLILPKCLIVNHSTSNLIYRRKNKFEQWNTLVYFHKKYFVRHTTIIRNVWQFRNIYKYIKSSISEGCFNFQKVIIFVYL